MASHDATKTVFLRWSFSNDTVWSKENTLMFNENGGLEFVLVGTRVSEVANSMYFS